MALKSVGLLGVLLACATLNMGCATLFKGSMSSMTIEGLPRGAEVETLDGVRVERESRDSVRLSVVDPPRAVRVKADGRVVQLPASRFVGAGWILLDILFGVVPLIVDAGSGSWYEYEDVVMPRPKSIENVATP
jgi:hypothetical protein